ncbi:MAG: DUF368 domain-containing protein [Oscillospiraceae bacterium]|nr:DUF368 domain-containing protein [Oscillospiraceae bacterium]
MKTLKTFLYRIVCGFFLGLSVFAPGFSGSVMAIAMGIYQDLLKIMSNPLHELKKNLRFLIPLGIGIVLSGVLFVLTFRVLFERYEKGILLLFVGLIAGNLPVIGRELKQHSFKKRYLVGGLAAFGIALTFGILAVGGTAPGEAGVTAGFPEFAAAGFIAGAVTLVPGMSISAILIMLGVYGQLFAVAESLLSLELTYVPHLLAMLCAAVLGLVLTSRGIKKVFDRMPGFANACVFGFMSGTLIGIFVEALYIPDAYFNWWLGGGLFLAGLGIATGFILLGRYMNKQASA